MGEKVNYLSTYTKGNLTAETFYDKKEKSYGIDMFEDNNFQQRELFPNHSEEYAENAAENYVFGIKKI